MAMGNLMLAKVATRMVVLLQRPKGGKTNPNFTKMTLSERWRTEGKRHLDEGWREEN